jgi:hypothetical protein
MQRTHDNASSQPTLRRHAVFLSASIPDPERWQGTFDAIEVTDAVVAAGRSVLALDGVLVTAAHPTIAPLLLYVAAEFPAGEEPSVIVYQSDLFDDILPEPTRRFGEEGIGELRWTSGAAGDEPTPGRWDASLALMRRQMLADTDPVGAVFIGGMSGITDEFDLYQNLFPSRPVYPVGRPGGEARELVERAQSRVPDLLIADSYPALFRHVVADIAAQLSN